MPEVLSIIQLLVAPVVMISACGLLALAMYNRLATIISRARGFIKERFDDFAHLSRLSLDEQTSAQAELLRQRLGVLDLQIRRILQRARLVRNAVMCLLVTVGCNLLCSLLLGLSMLAPLQGAALAMFCAGVISMLGAVTLGMIELTKALDPVEIEQQSMQQHTDQLPL
ncbi:DUF2721 domain-containing protein [Planctomycetales bacterium ZRK34]|nr:DUF2721 domain-containing protein [Planctomycetales bacterium ZRK34]